MSERGRLGIVDWGIGGLDLYRKLRAAESTADVLYWSDSGAAPYGTLESNELAERLASVVRRMKQEGCSSVVVACNAASTALEHPRMLEVRDELRGRVLGVIAPTVAAIERDGLSEVAVIGGRRTIESGAYAVPLQAVGCRVVGQVAQPLSALIERGVVQGPELERCLDPILAPLRGCATLVLACTHYVAVQEVIERRLPTLHRVIDPAAETLRWMQAAWGLPRGRGTAQFVTTGSTVATQEAARLAFGIELADVESRPTASGGVRPRRLGS